MEPIDICCSRTWVSDRRLFEYENFLTISALLIDVIYRRFITRYAPTYYQYKYISAEWRGFDGRIYIHAQ